MCSPTELPLRPAALCVGAGAALLLALAMPVLAQQPAPAASAAASASDGEDDAAAPADGGLFTITAAPTCAYPLCYSANSMSATRNHMLMIHPDIVDTTRGVSHITADRAEMSGADIGNSEWVLTGHVRADMSEGQLRADTATIHIVDRQIVSITARGSPALFQRPAQTMPAAGSGAGAPAAGSGAAGGAQPGLASLSVRGHAETITYDAQHRQVQFRGDSWFSDGCNDITSQLVTYSMSQQSVQAGGAPGGSGRVHGTIRNTRPGSASGCAPGSGHT